MTSPPSPIVNASKATSAAASMAKGFRDLVLKQCLETLPAGARRCRACTSEV